MDSPVPAHVQPPYYAAIIAAEAIGGSGATRVVEIEIDHERVSGYAFYDDGSEKVGRVVLLNSQAWFEASAKEGEERLSVHISLPFDSTNAPGNMRVKRLSIGYADDTSGLKWGGRSYETLNGLADGEEEVKVVAVVNGVDISASEVVLLVFV